MGIVVEFNPDLALRDMAEHRAGRREASECIPEDIEAGKTYAFLKKGQRNYWLFGEIPLLETKGEGVLSRPRASIHITEAMHFLRNGEVWTRGTYEVVEVFTDDRIRFEGLARVGAQEF